MKLPAYPEYALTRDAWVGSAPSHWKFLRADFTTFSNKEQISDKAMEGINVLHYSIPNVQEFGTAQIEDGNEIDSAKLRITTPQLLISKLNPRKATLCIAAPDEKLLTVCSGEFVPIIPDGELTLRYCYYTWISDKVTKLLSSRVQSVTRSHQRVSPEDITKLPWAWPPNDEQKKIAAFLDWKTGQIDALIALKQELLERLKEKRLVVITQAVTRGLNSAAPLRSSGMPWFDQVPKHWQIMQLRRRWGILDCKHKTVSFVDEGIPVASIREVHEFEVNLDGAHKTTEDEYFDLIEGGRAPQVGDIIYSRNATVGDAAIVTTLDRFCMGQDVCLLRNQQAVPQFVAYLLRSYPLREQAQALMIGSTFNRINVGQIKAFWVPVPPAEEQDAIAGMLDERTRELDLMVNKVVAAISSLTEYRAALITAATTGKIDVRTVKIPEPL